MKTRLTQRQNQTYEFLRAYSRRHRKPPTLQEIADALGLRSTNAVSKLLAALERKGYIVREPHAARGTQAVEPEEDAFSLNGRIPNLPFLAPPTDGDPEKLRRSQSGSLHIDPFFLHSVQAPDECLVMRAGDDGMNGDSIRKGDFLVIEPAARESLRNGEVAAFLVRGQLQARRYYLANGQLHLRPADRTYMDETFAPGDPACHVVGRVLSVLRRL